MMKNGGKIMKTNKRRLLAALTATTLALTPCFAAGMMNAVAADSTTLTVTDSDGVTHDYNAYQIIKGTTGTDGKLQSLAIGNGITQDNLITAVNAVLGSGTLGSSASVDDIAVKLATIESDSEDANKLAKELAKYKVTANAFDLKKSGDNYTNTSLTNGWYLILDETDPLAPANGTTSTQVRSANLLKLTQNTEIKTKHSLPTLDKKITGENENADGSANRAAIGDTVEYEIDLTVPDVTGYDKYFYVEKITLSAGLTYNDDLRITLGGAPVTEDTDGVGDTVTTGDFYVTHDGTSIKVVFKNAATFFKNKTVDAPIVITYTATLNENAVIGDAGNPNTAKLVYSNDPNEAAEGTPADGGNPPKPDEPGPNDNDVTGETPEDTVKTFTTAIKIKKVDQSGNPLAGATFKLSGTGINKVKVESVNSFTADPNGTYWKLTNGSYTTTDPATLADTSDYDSTTTKYSKYTVETASVASGDTNKSVTATVDENGFLTFSGLDAGVYKLEETVAPTGYNGASAIDFTISADVNATPAFSSNNSAVAIPTGGNMFETSVENRYGAQLPSTGGVCTKLFYLFGSAFVIGASTFIVTKKRVGTNK